MIKLNLVSKSVQTALFVGAISTFGTFGAVAAEEEIKEEIEQIEVTGSRIKRVDMEGPSPVVVISGAEMEAAGFSNVYDALQNLSMSAGVAGEQSANSSQTAGQQINIRGLGPSRALTLINGRRVTDNPTASYNGGSFFDYSLIPLAAVERVEVLTGGGSAVYGSDAVAGVINVILKKDVTDTTIRLTHGQATAGGDVTNKVQLVGGFQTDSASLTYAFEYQDEGGLNAKDIDRLDGLDDNPNGFDGRPNSQAWHYIYGRTFVSPTDEECEAVAPGSKSLPYGPGFTGNVCGSTEADNYSIKNPRERMNAMVNFSMDLTDDVELFGTAIAWGSKTNNQIFRKWMQAVRVDPNTGNYSNQLITFAQDEFPASSFNEKETYVGMFGARGTLLEDYDWELGFNLSNTSEYAFAQQFKQSAVTEWVNTTNYNPFVKVTAADFSDDAIGNRWTDATSESRSVDFQITGALMELDAGPVQFSTILEYKFDEYEIKVDEIATQGHIVDGGWTNGSANFGAGDRERFSAGIEFLVPITEQIEIGFATRYDAYHDKSEVGGRPTSQFNIAYRPTDSLLLRASAAQSFRAPDKHYLFKERQDSYYNGGVTDVYTCRADDEANYTDGCLDFNSNTLSGYTARYQGQGNPNLKEENGENISIGMAYEFTENANITIDYWNIKMEDQVNRLTQDQIFQNASLYSDLFTTKIDNATGDEILAVIQAAVNIGEANTSGIDWNFTTTSEFSLGTLRTTIAGTYMIESENLRVGTNDTWDTSLGQVGPNAAVTFRNIVAVSNSFTHGDFVHNLNIRARSGYQDAKASDSFNVAYSADWTDTVDGDLVIKEVPAYMTVDYRLSYNMDSSLNLAFGITNLMDKEPPFTLNAAAGHQAGYDPRYHSPYGRTFYMSANYTF